MPGSTRGLPNSMDFRGQVLRHDVVYVRRVRTLFSTFSIVYVNIEKVLFQSGHMAIKMAAHACRVGVSTCVFQGCTKGLRGLKAKASIAASA